MWRRQPRVGRRSPLPRKSWRPAALTGRAANSPPEWLEVLPMLRRLRRWRMRGRGPLLEKISGMAVDAPLCFTCGTKMRRSGSCYICEGCGSTSGCS